MRVLLTGHKGYIGTILVPMLLEAGHDVVGLDNDLFRRCTFKEGMVDIPEIIKDVRDIEANDVQDFDAVLHLAGLSNDPLGDFNPDITFQINHQASVRLAELAKEAGVSRFIFSSSCSNYGAAGDDLLNEESANNPVTPYGESKVLVERDLSKMADGSFTPTYLRNATAYGVSPRLRFDLVLNNLVAWAYCTKQVYLKSDGTPWRPVVHIEDISRAFMAVLHAPRDTVHDQAFNIGRNEENYRIREIADIVADTVPDCRIEYAPDAGPDLRCYRVDCSKAIEMLPEFKPQWTVRKGAQELYNVYQQVGLTLDEFEGTRFSRIAHLRSLIDGQIITNELRLWSDEPVQSAAV